MRIPKPKLFTFNKYVKMSILRNYAAKLAIEQNLCNFLCYFSVDTWKRIEFTRSHFGLKIFETTITQNLLYNLNTDFYGFSIQMFEAIDESANGNDIELFIQTRNGFIFAPTQAKIIYSSNLYEAMEHGNQITDLINYANRFNGIPLYLLYNYYNNNDFNVNGSLCGIRLAKELYGCSLVSADLLNNHFAFNRIDRNGNLKWTIPSFKDLHPDKAIPLFVLGCCIPNKTFNEAIEYFFPKDFNPNNSKEKYKKYTITEILNDDKWIPFNLKRIYKDRQVSRKGFNPRFRIILMDNNKIAEKQEK